MVASNVGVMNDPYVRRPVLTLREAKAALESFAGLYMEICENVELSDDDQLSVLANAPNLLTSTNCWWATKGVAPIVAELAWQEIRRRDYARQQEIRAARST